MPDLSKDIQAFEHAQRELESAHLGKWALFYDAALVEVFESFEAAAAIAVAKFGRGPYLIRQIGASPRIFPASVMYRQINA